MSTITIFLQGEFIPDIQVVELGRNRCVKDLLATAAEHRRCEAKGDFHVFTEDGSEPLGHDYPLPMPEDGQPLCLHVHRCHRIEVAVTFNGQTERHHFGPGTTISAVKRWAAQSAFEMDPADAAEHALQIASSTDRPEPDSHIGALVTWQDCCLTLDLVPLKRVEG